MNGEDVARLLVYLTQRVGYWPDLVKDRERWIRHEKAWVRDLAAYSADDVRAAVKSYLDGPDRTRWLTTQIIIESIQATKRARALLDKPTDDRARCGKCMANGPLGICAEHRQTGLSAIAQIRASMKPAGEPYHE